MKYDIFLLRQIPYAIGQFTVNEFCHELAFRKMSEETKRNLSKTQKYGIALGSGVTAGFAAAILSHVNLYPLPSHPCN
jgi:solute carrier family 25 (mitochondrial phosphate transporter), member 3